MSDEAISVRPEVLRRAAGRLADEGYRLAHGLAGVPGLVVPAPGWSAGAALAGLESAVHGWCGRLGARVAATGDAVSAADEAYRAADDRAAARLAALPR
ncbi:hypothetical protein Q3W71_12670 [Micromonospora sp. C28SCA-DRY-2]|uniref:hypothetical protein n=1 Tax=Micromonospora sp. C28SCA-DRY-2 TaxID=3059522 RepID=UPI002676984E|nr:hypothetical protein [Micromonospora sp. C28SCA-DRY-2]MDO3702525.1 hypothetical protein [Micromonospora sp. C28SCA-DRY-2]